MAFEWEDIRAWLWAKGARSACPLCGKDDQWMGLGGEDRPEPLVISAMKEDGTPDPDIGFGAVGMGCGNCGYLLVLSMEAMQSAMNVPEHPPDSP